jgi:cyclic beta-1,2-glucan glucanotransferase
VLATALRGDGARAFELFQMLNPLTHASTPEGAATYKVEPYVIAADVYTAEGHLGRGGWTWYTGSASWTYRVALEAILGFTKHGDHFTMNPVLPPAWDGFELTYRAGAAEYHVVVRNPLHVARGVTRVTVDGVECADGRVMLAGSGRREVVVELGA